MKNKKLQELELDYFESRVSSPSECRMKAAAAYEAGSSHIEIAKDYVRHLYGLGHLESLLPFENTLGRSESVRRLFANIKSNVQLLRHGFNMPSEEYREHLERVDKRRVLYFLHNSLPIDSGGYATRTHGLLTGISENGYRISGVTRLGYPHDRKKAFAGKTFNTTDLVSGVGYLRNNSREFGIGKQPLVEYLQRNLHANMALIRKDRPAILHGASNYINGVTANFLSRKFGLKSIYEVRGLWELTRASREPGYDKTDAYNQYARMEAEACHNADHVFAITQALKDIMVDRGVDASKITIVPNGVDIDRFMPTRRDDGLGVKLGISTDETVIGYVGTIVDYEGIDDLLKAFAKLAISSENKARLLIVGDGAALPSLRELADELELGERVIFTGRVPHDQVRSYYSLIDIAPFPRKPLPVTEAVSPLKPFEAMAMEKCVVASDVEALKEFVIDDETGVTFAKGNVDALAVVLNSLIQDNEMRRKIAWKSRRWVMGNRDWRSISGVVTDIYEQLTESAF